MKSFRNWPLFLTVILASAAILIAGTAGLMRPVENSMAAVVAPVQYAVEQLVRGVVSVVSIPHDLLTLRQENQQLKAQVDHYINQLTLVRELQIENAQLRELLGLREKSPDILGPEADLLVAEVIGHDPNNLLRYLTIDRGSRDRVKPGMPVITARGLVGQISEVGTDWARVLLLTDPSSQVHAVVQRSRATGLVYCEAGADLIMRLAPQVEVTAQPGDLVLTSGLGGRFPRRLLIGEITEVRRRDVDMFQEAHIRPAIDFSRLETVIVVRYFTPIGVEAQPSPG